MAEREDINYHISGHATADKEPVVDVDQPRKSVLEEVLEELETDIAKHNSFDVLHLPANATNKQKVAAFDEIAIHKGLALNLNKYKSMIENKLKELK